MASQGNLLLRAVYPENTVTCGYDIARHRDAGTTAEIEHPRTAFLRERASSSASHRFRTVEVPCRRRYSAAIRS